MKRTTGTTGTGTRLRLMLAFWAVALVALVVRAVDLQVVQHEFLARQGDMRNLRVEPLAAHRGVITDRAGRPLAVSTPVTSLWANPREVLEAREHWAPLRNNDVLDIGELAKKVEGRDHREFVYLARHLAPGQAEKVLSLDIPGIYPLTEYRRYYPAGEVTSHVVGFTNIDERGQEGMELAYDERLRGEPGRKKVVRDLRGRVIRDLEVLEPARPGEGLALSLDLRVQYLAYRELLGAVSRHNARGGSVVVLDAATGEVLAMVNQPAYNPNNRARLEPSTLRNRAVTDLFEPGSTIKPLTVAAALQRGMVTPSTSVDTRPGSIRVGGKTIRDHRNYGVIDVTTILTKSSNVGATKLALNMDDQALPSFFQSFGLGEATGVEFPGESQGVLPFRGRWRDIEQATLSYGYGVSVTALQLARAYAVLANDGVRMPVSLSRRDGQVAGERVVSSEVARSLVDMLETVVSREGTASRARVAGYKVAGKTGTVHKVTDKGYADDRYVALFAGMAPASDPRFVTVVVVDDPRGEDYFGGLVSAPVFSRIMEGVLRTLHVAPDGGTEHWAGGDVGEGRT